jgi:predicted phage terminase large subunit-like protein
MQAICDHLQAITEGKIKRLIINVPPGFSKSLLTNVFWPAWEWGPRGCPHLRIVSASHSQNLAIRDSTRCRDLISSEWYATRWPIQLKDDQNAKLKFANMATGFREAAVYSTMTGTRGNRVIIDDPMPVAHAESQVELEKAEYVCRQVIPSRVNNEAKDAIVYIQQRLHERDTTAVLLDVEPGKWEHLSLPMEFEPDRACKTSIFADPRKVAGELLFPERFPQETVDDKKNNLGPYGYSAQYQQRPTPIGGGLIKREWWKLWPSDKKIPKFSQIIQSYDTAFSDKETADSTAFTVWGVFLFDGRMNAMLIDCWAERLTYPDLLLRAIREWNEEYDTQTNGRGDYLPRRADWLLVENKSSGHGLIPDLHRRGVPATSIERNRQHGDKTARVHSALPYLSSGQFWIPESKNHKNQPVSWADAFLKQLTNYRPGGTGHDDYVDSWSQAVLWMKASSYLDVHDKADPIMRFEKPQRDFVNPYS